MTKSVQRRRGIFGRWAFVGVAASLALFLPIAQSPALAVIDVGDSVYIGAKQGYGGTGVFPIWSETPVDLSNPGDPDAWAYCLENQVSARTGLNGQVGDLSSYLGENFFGASAIQGKVLWVLAHSYPAIGLTEFGAAAGVPDISRNDAIEATQYAIWRYTDLDFDANWSWETVDSEAAYWYLVNGANGNPGFTPADFAVTAGLTAPADAQTGGSLVGPFVVSTNQDAVTVSTEPQIVLTDAGGNAIDGSNLHDGDQLYLDLRDVTVAGSATLRVSANGASSTGKVVSVAAPSGGDPTRSSHAQSIVLVAPSTATTEAEATVEWAGLAGPAPLIGTSLVDAADQDRVLAWNGGTLVDTVAYQNLVPGTEYTVTGELMRKSDGTATGLTGSGTFTPTATSGSADVTFTVPEGYAGETLVAFEWLFEGTDTSGEAVAEHADINDAAQTVVVEQAPIVPATSPGAKPAVALLAKTGADGLPMLATGGGVLFIVGALLVLARARRAA